MLHMLDDDLAPRLARLAHLGTWCGQLPLLAYCFCMPAFASIEDILQQQDLSFRKALRSA